MNFYGRKKFTALHALILVSLGTVYMASALSAEDPEELDRVTVIGIGPAKPDKSPFAGIHFNSPDGNILNASANTEPVESEKNSPSDSGCPDKTKGKGKSPTTGKPVIIATGEKILEEVDFEDRSLYPLTLKRTYRSSTPSNQMLGNNWHFEHFFPRIVGAGCRVPDPIEQIASGPKAARLFKSKRIQAHARQSQSLATPSNVCLPTTISVIKPDGSKFNFRWLGGAGYYRPEGKGSFTTVGNVYVEGITSGHEWIVEIDNLSYHYNGQTKQLMSIQRYGYPIYQYAYNANGQLQSVTAGGGGTLRLTWSGSRVSQITAPNGQVWSYTYDSNGNLTQVSPPASTGGPKTYHYESPVGTHLLTGYTVNGLRSTRYAYHDNGQVQRSAKENGESVDTFNYTSNSTTVTNELGQSTTYNFELDGSFRRLVSTSRAGTSTCGASAQQQSYDSYGFTRSQTDWRGITTTFTKNDSGQMLSRTIAVNTPDALRSTFVWDGYQLKEQADYNASNQLLRKQQFTYYTTGLPMSELASAKLFSPNGTLLQQTDYSYTFHANGVLASKTITRQTGSGSVSSKVEYSSAGHLIRETNAAGHVTSYSGHNGLGLPSTVTDANGVVTTLSYDAAGRVLSTSTALSNGNRVSNFSYNADGQLTSASHSSGWSASYGYNSAGRLTQITQAGGTLGFGLDVGARQQTSTSPRQLPGGMGADFSSRRVMDSLGRPYTDQGNNGQKTDYRYDNNGNLISTTDALGRQTRIEYNARDLPIKVTLPDGGVIVHTYDALGYLRSTTDPRGLTTSYTVDAGGRVTQRISPDTGTSSYSYDMLDRVTSETRADGRVISYAYDALGRLTSRSGGGLTETYGYDAGSFGRGRLTSYSDASGSTSLSYNAAGELINQTQSIAGQTLVSTWSYDAAGRLTGMSYPTGLSLSYAYDGYGRLASISSNHSGSWSTVLSNISYHPGSASPMSWRFASGLTRAVTQDTDGRITLLDTGSAHRLQYTHNNTNTIASISDLLYASQTTTLGYDANDRVTQSGSSVQNHSFSWDRVGNRSTQTAATGYLTHTLASNSNRLVAVSGSAWRSFTYDGVGNLASESRWDGSRSYRYDGFHRMNGITVNGNASSYLVNALNQRVSKSAPSASARYAYGPGGELLAETGTTPTSYVWFAGQLVGLVRGGQFFASHNDHLGRPEVVTNASGTPASPSLRIATIWLSVNLLFLIGLFLSG